jgi:hypothetical protein
MRTLPFVLLTTQVRMTLADRVGSAPPFWLASRVAEQSAVSVHGPQRRFCFQEQ